MSSPSKEGDDSSKISVQDDQIRRAQLQMQFRGTRKVDFQTMEAYVNELKSIANSLAEIDSPISDPNMVLQLLAGLPSEYLPLQTTISSRCPLPTFEEACSMVYMQQALLSKDHGEQITGDPGVVDAKQSSAFCTLEKLVTAGTTVVAVVGTVSTVVAAATTLSGAVGAVGAVGASRMIVAGAMTAVAGAVAGWKLWQANKYTNY
ncbi:hypothetical protein P3S68_020367 [Capsicum galapagoense]